MNRLRLHWLAPLLAVPLAGMVGGCGHDGENSAGGAAGRTTITFMMGFDFSRPMIEGLIEEFEREHPTIDVDLQWVPGPQYQTKLKTLIAAGQAPDVFMCGDVWVAYYLPFLHDVTPLLERDAAEIDLDDFYPRLLESCRHEGRYYFLPRWFNISLLYYNKKLFREANVPFPTDQWTWDDYVRAGQALTQRDDEGHVAVWGSQITAYWWGEWLILVQQAGGSLFDSQVRRCLLDSPEAKRGMQFYYDKVYKYKFAPPPGFGPDQGLVSNRVAMELGGHTGMWIIYNDLKLDWDIEILPAGPVTRNGGELSFESLGISKTTDHLEEAWEFMKFMSSPRSIEKHVDRGFLAVRKSVAESVLFQKYETSNPRNIRAVYKQLEFVAPVPRLPDYIELALEIIQPDIDNMLTNQIDPGETCDRVAAFANRFLDTVASQRERGAAIP